MSTIANLLKQAQTQGIDRLDAQLLLGHVLQKTRAWLLANDDAGVSEPDEAAASALFLRRADGVPLAYLVEEKEFHGLTLKVTPSVLVPRPDTETLVDWALELMPPASSVLDMGTGSGAIALALKHRRPQVKVSAIDASEAALAVARENGLRLGLEVDWQLSDWWQHLNGRSFDLIVSNPPYIAGGDPHLPALKHEPSLALTPGGDGLDSIRQIIVGAARHMNPGSWLLLEHGHDQAQSVAGLLHAAGFREVTNRCDLAGHTRCTGGRCS